MFYKSLSLLCLFFSIKAQAFSTIRCQDSQALTYSSQNLTGGARPFPGMMTHIEEIKNAHELIYRKVHREPCLSGDQCQIQQPEMSDIDLNIGPFHFVDETKQVIESEGQSSGPYRKETYVIQFFLVSKKWMLCESTLVFYP
jgi:hypothetical protein